MTYELKSIRPGSIFMASLPINLFIGFLSAFLSYVIIPALPSGNVSPFAAIAVWQRLLFTLLFTLVYGAAASGVLSLLSLIYNAYASRFKGIVMSFQEDKSL